jgi:[acyl-carrier-protein] S-malonyltransferase
MSKTIGLFPGQGAQTIGMGSQIAKEFAPAAFLLKQADDILGFSLSDMMFEGPDEDLRFTANTQPALFVTSMMVWELLKSQGVSVDMVAGHSLGEYSAICAAGGFSFEDGLRLVRVRGELMGSAGVKQPGAMSAVMGMEAAELEAVLQQASQEGVVVAANFNCPGQIVISGSVQGVAKAGELLTDMQKKVVPLPVSGAFHSPLMEFALDGLKEAVYNTRFSDLQIPLIANVTTQPVQSAKEVQDLLVKQLVSPVKWEQSMRTALDAGVTAGLEIGVGKVLMGLMRKISRDIKVTPIDSKATLESFFKLILFALATFLSTFQEQLPMSTWHCLGKCF